jgi:ribosome-associated protein
VPALTAAAARRCCQLTERPPLESPGASSSGRGCEGRYALDLASTTMADYFVICSGGSERQLEAIANGVIGSLRDERIKPIGREGTSASHWILIDFGSVIVHVFTPPERDYYGLEKHWAQAKTILRVQ